MLQGMMPLYRRQSGEWRVARIRLVQKTERYRKSYALQRCPVKLPSRTCAFPDVIIHCFANLCCPRHSHSSLHSSPAYLPLALMSYPDIDRTICDWIESVADSVASCDESDEQPPAKCQKYARVDSSGHYTMTDYHQTEYNATRGRRYQGRKCIVTEENAP